MARAGTMSIPQLPSYHGMAKESERRRTERKRETEKQGERWLIKSDRV
jgi:hypothetical protein